MRPCGQAHSCVERARGATAREFLERPRAACDLHSAPRRVGQLAGRPITGTRLPRRSRRSLACGLHSALCALACGHAALTRVDPTGYNHGHAGWVWPLGAGGWRCRRAAESQPVRCDGMSAGRGRPLAGQPRTIEEFPESWRMQAAGVCRFLFQKAARQTDLSLRFSGAKWISPLRPHRS